MGAHRPNSLHRFHVLSVLLTPEFESLSLYPCRNPLSSSGLTNKNMRLYADAKDSFVKLHTIVRSHPQIIYQIARCSELLGDIDQATEW